MTTYYQKFGEKVRKFRKKKGISQEELASEVKIDYSYMNKIENGKANPSLKVIYRLSKTLGVKSSNLLPF